MVEYLVQVGADVTIQANDGCRALDLALVIINSKFILFYMYSNTWPRLELY